MSNHITIGILAHVDAGKTTLSESILYLTGSIRKLGRVDHKNTFLDNNAIEQNRGITVFSKEARFNLGEKEYTLLDTPGHTDFSTEMERTLQVLDYAILVVSGAEGVQAHTETLWKLMSAYKIPTFIFVNKMDQPETDRQKLMEEISKVFGDGLIEIDEKGRFSAEEAAMCSESLMEEYLETGVLSMENIRKAVLNRYIFPVCFGSALKMEGIKEFLETFSNLTMVKKYGQAFGARVYKITRDKQGNRQTHLKITGGVLKNKMLLSGIGEDGHSWQEKAEQIRLYSGSGFQQVQEACAGMVCAVTGLTKTFAGQGLGEEEYVDSKTPVLQPALTYKIILPEETEPVSVLHKLRQLEEEDPTLHIVWKEVLGEIHVQVMGELELEILANIIEQRFDLKISFGEGSIIYKETISAPIVGIGHFEPLRHYAEVHLLMEPMPRGSGLVFGSICSEDKLDRNWQRLVMTHLAEKSHAGVLTGSDITDMKITLIAGKAHLKHTDGGDFRQATYRAVRQGLCKAESILLEPVYRFRLKVPAENVGRAMSDMQMLGARCSMPELIAGSDMNLIKGVGPVASLRGYQQQCSAYTRGRGKFIAIPDGYSPCHNAEEVVADLGYRQEQDISNPAGSVFCQHGSAIYVDWKRVDEMAHVDSGYRLISGELTKSDTLPAQSDRRRGSGLTAAGEKELEEIFLKTYGKSKRDEAIRREALSRGSRRTPEKENFPEINWKTERKKGTPFLIIDGYNVIFAWEELSGLAKVNLDSAREAFLDILGNYQGYKKTGMVVVFDGYRVSGNPGNKLDYDNIKVIYTKEAETADRFIERTVFEMGREYDVTVVTSDRPVQMAAIGDGARRLSAREFHQEVVNTSEEIREKLKRQQRSKNQPFAQAFKDFEEEN